MNLTFRLNRHIPGESLLAERELVTRTRRLEVVKPRLVQVAPAKDLSKHETRRIRNIVDAGPNAPQLKRLIQYPYTQSTTYPRLGKPWRQPKRLALEITPAGEAVKEAMAVGKRPRWPRVTRKVFGPQARPRPSLDAYLVGEESP